MTDAGKRLIASAEEAKAEFERKGGKSLAQVKAETMTDAPERVLLAPNGGLPTGNYPKAALVEYIRADLVPDWSSDMDAAPKDGTFILVFSPDAVDPEWNDPGIRVSNWEAGQWHGFPWTAKGPYAVTHWMRIAPPKEGE